MIALGMLAFALVIVVGIVVHKSIELPLMAFVRRASSRRQRISGIQPAANAACVEPASEASSYGLLTAEPAPALTPTEP